MLEGDIYSLLYDAEWLMSTGCRYYGIDYEYAILLHSLDLMHVSNQNADSELLPLPQSDISKGMTWHMQKERHDDNSDRGRSQMKPSP